MSNPRITDTVNRTAEGTWPDGEAPVDQLPARGRHGSFRPQQYTINYWGSEPAAVHVSIRGPVILSDGTLGQRWCDYTVSTQHLEDGPWPDWLAALVNRHKPDWYPS